jgi:hypothetical protein
MAAIFPLYLDLFKIEKVFVWDSLAMNLSERFIVYKLYPSSLEKLEIVAIKNTYPQAEEVIKELKKK